MKKLLALLLALTLVMSLVGCFPTNSTQVPELPDESISAQAPTEEATALPTEEIPAFPTEEETEPATEEETVYDPRPHPADTPTEETIYDPRPHPADTPTEPATQPATQPSVEVPTETPTESEYPLDRYGFYTSRDDVALFIHIFGCLPSNYITKSQAKSLYGSTKNIPSYLNIGGDRFYNKEGLLPSGHTYYECDIGTSGGSNRGARRIVFSTDGLIYYTNDHYQSFTLLYGEP